MQSGYSRRHGRALAVRCSQIPEAADLLKIKGLSLITVAGIFAEIGDIRRFESPRQLQKLAELALKENSSGNCIIIIRQGKRIH